MEQDKEGPAWADPPWGVVVRGGLETTGQQGSGGGQPGPWRAGAGLALPPSHFGAPWGPPAGHPVFRNESGQAAPGPQRGFRKECRGRGASPHP